MTASNPSANATDAGASEPAVVVRLDGVHKVFDSSRGRHEALRSIDLEIYDGEFLTILGPSGCGKTTLLRVLAGFETPTRGEVILDGRRCTDMPANKRPMAMVFQNYALFPHLNVFDNIAYGLRLAKVRRAEIAERVEVVLSIMDLVGLGKRLPGQLSGGQQQRVALARSVIVRPRVLLFDEPLSNLDARLRDQMRGELRRVQQQLGVTSVYVTHDQTEAMAMSDRIVVMSNGRLEQVGTPVEVYRRPVSLFVADFIGKAVVLDCSIVRRGVGEATLSMFGEQLTVSDPGADGEPLTAVVRPEDLSVVGVGADPELAQRSDPAVIRLDGWLRSTEFLGSESHLRVELADGTLLDAVAAHHAAADPELLPRIGDRVRVEIPRHAVRAVIDSHDDVSA